MIDLERPVGPFSLRAWGLIANLAGNVLALYGVAGVLQDGSRWALMVVGLIVTAACMLVLAIPSPDDSDDPRQVADV